MKSWTDAIASAGGTTIKSFDTKTNTEFSQVPIGFAPLTGVVTGSLYAITLKNNNKYVVCRFLPGSNGGVDSSNAYSIRVFYIE